MFSRKMAALSALPIMLVSSLSLCACQGRGSVQPEAVLMAPTPAPTPPIDQAQLAPDTQQNPYRQFVPGLLVRTVYKAEQAGRLGVEIWELLVGPGKKTDSVTLPGGAIFELRAGSGVVTVNGKPAEARTGATFSVEDGQTFQIENKSTDDGISIRVVLVRGSQN